MSYKDKTSACKISRTCVHAAEMFSCIKVRTLLVNHSHSYIVCMGKNGWHILQTMYDMAIQAPEELI